MNTSGSVDAASIPRTSMFHPSNREMLNNLIRTEVQTIMDQLKKSNPELQSKEALVKNLNDKTLKYDGILQQFSVNEQRLGDKVKDLSIKIQAIQSNLDDIHKDAGGTFVTEEQLKSWTAHYFSEHVSSIKQSLWDDLNKAKLAYQTQETQYRRMIQEELAKASQQIFERTCFIKGTVMHDAGVDVFQLQNDTMVPVEKTWHFEKGQQVRIYYPIVERQDGLWMKTRRVDSTNASLEEGWIPIVYQSQVMLGEFQL